MAPDPFDNIVRNVSTSSSNETQATIEPASIQSNSVSAKLLEENGHTTRLFPKWPQGPRKLPGIRDNLFSVLLDVYALLPLCLSFLGFCAYAYQNDRKVLDQKGQLILDVAHYATTVFPYLFATIASRFLKAIAKWKLESKKGVSLGSLKFLLTSNNIFNAFQNPIAARVFNWLALILLALWALSPLGSQATLRVVSSQLRTVNSNTSIGWLSPTTAYPSAEVIGAINTQDILFSSALLSSPITQGSALDIYHNIKLPMLETNTSFGEQWEFLTNTTQYSSLLGIPVHSDFFPGAEDGNTSFILSNVTYWVSDCFAQNHTRYGLNASDADSIPNMTNYSSWYSNQIGTGGFWQIAIKTNMTANTHYEDETDSPWAPPYTQLQPSGGPVEFVFEQLQYYHPLDSSTSTAGEWILNHLDCHLTTSAIDLMVNCTTPSSCTSTAARFNPISHKPNTFWGSPQTFTTFASPRGLNTSSILGQENGVPLIWFLNNLAKSLPSTPHNAEQGSSTAFEFYLYDPSSNPFVAGYTNGPPFANLSNLPAQTIGWRLSQLMNTYRLAAMDPSSIASNSWNPEEYSSNAEEIYETYQDGRMIYTTETYFHCNKIWLAILVFAVCILLAANICSIRIALSTKGPDILDIISALTRENDISVPKNEGTALNGDERTRLLRRVNVRLLEGGGEDEPRVVLGSSREASELKSDGLYR